MDFSICYVMHSAFGNDVNVVRMCWTLRKRFTPYTCLLACSLHLLTQCGLSNNPVSQTEEEMKEGRKEGSEQACGPARISVLLCESKKRAWQL